MKSQIKGKTSKPFPKLMVNVGNNIHKGMVIFFSCEHPKHVGMGSGIVVHTVQGNHYKIGDIAGNWDMQDYVDYDNSIILSNQ